MAIRSLHKQLFHHDPANGIYGDCYRTCIASLCSLNPEDVPNFNDGTANAEQADRSASAWLADHGLAFVTFTVPGSIDDLPGILREVADRNPGTHYILSGLSRTGVNHAVIAFEEEIVWDPSLNDAGIVGPMSDDPKLGFMFEFLAIPGGVAACQAGHRISGLTQERDELLDQLRERMLEQEAIQASLDALLGTVDGALSKIDDRRKAA